MNVWMKRTLGVAALLAGLNCAHAKELVGAAFKHRAGIQSLAASGQPEVYRCKTESETNSYSCLNTPLASPFDASGFDYAVGGHITFDGAVAVYNMRYSLPDGTIYNERFTLIPQSASFCAGGYRSGQGTTFDCFYGGVFDVIFVRRRVGQWKIELLADDVVQWTAYSNVKAAEIRKISGDGSTAPLGEALRTKPTFSLYHFDNTLIDISESSTGTATDIVNFTITGPRKATGMMVSSPVYPDNATSAPLAVTLGDKLGTYTVKGTVTGATMPSPFTFTAVGREEAPDNSDEEEGNGDEPCSAKVGDPITIGLGNSFQQEADYPRTGLSILEFSRSYNAFGSKSRLMGNYWTTTFDRFVTVPTAAGQPAKIRRPDGRTITFNDVSGIYTARAYFEGILIKTGSGWKYTDESQAVELFDTSGRLLSMADRVGRNVTMTYDATTGNLTKATANTGEFLTFIYNSYKQVVSATDIGGRVWTYKYDGYSNLTQVARPFGSVRNYYYKDPLSPFLMTSYWDNGREVFWNYDDQGRVVSNYFLGGHYVPDGLKRVDISYLPNGNRAVTDSLGRVTTYQTQLANGRGFVNGVVGSGFASCGFADSQLAYDADMNITSRTQFGKRTEYGNFDSKGQSGFVIEAAGTVSARRTDFSYDSRFVGYPTVVTSPSVAPGQLKTVAMGYDSAGNLLSKSISGFRPDGTAISRAVTYEYAGPFGQLTRIDGPRADVADITTLDYDATSKRLIRVTNADGVVLRNNLTYATNGQLTSEDRPNGLKLTYTYVAGTNLIATLAEAQGSVTRTTTWTYTGGRQVNSITYRDGINTDLIVGFYYDLAGDLLGITNPNPGNTEGGLGISFTRDTEGNPTGELTFATGFTPARYQVDRIFDAYNRVDKLINFTGTIDYDYHPDGTLRQVTDGKQQVTTYEFDDFRRMTRAIEPEQRVTSYAYDVQDTLVKVTDPNLGVTNYVVDDLGNLLQLQSPDTGMTQYSFDGAGNAVAVTDAKGQSTTRTYSPGNRMMAVDRPGIAEDEIYTYDNCLNGMGMLCQVASGNGEFVAYEYDGFGRPGKVSTRNGSVAYSYDAKSNVTAITYPSGRRATYTYNTGGQVTKVALTDGLRQYTLASNFKNMPMGPAQSWTYGNGLVESRQFNSQFLPTSLGVAGKFAVTYPSYDMNANIAQMVVDGQAQNYEYDGLDRLTAASGGFGIRNYSYDPVGNRLSTTADGITTTSTYQSQSNRLTRDSNWTYVLDPNGNQIQKTDSASLGNAYDFTAQNQLENVSSLTDPTGSIATYLYNALGQRTFKSLNGQERRFVYGVDGKLLAESLVDGTIVEEYVYLNGQPLALLGTLYTPQTPPAVDAIVDDVAAGGPWTVKKSQSAYGGSYQALTIADPYWDEISWNWTPTVAGFYDVWTWWMRRAGDGDRTFYSVDGGYQIGVVSHASQTLGTWAYLGRFHLTPGRVALTLPESLNSPNYGSPSGRSLAADAARFKLFEQDTGQEGHFNYVLTDHLGTPLAVTDWNKQIVWKATYDPFGAATVNSDPDGNGQPFTLNLRFPGQYYDVESGLYYNYFRDYDPATGRYLQPDPIGLAGGISTYGYVGGNPLGNVDSLGLFTVTAFPYAMGGNGLETRYQIDFDPISTKDIPGLGGKLRKPFDWIERVNNALKPRHSGPIHPLKDSIKCGLLDAKLDDEYGDIAGKRLTQGEAERILNAMYLAHPEMRKLYPLPSKMLEEAAAKAKSNPFWKLNQQVFGGSGE